MIPSYCCNYRGKLIKANFLILVNFRYGETICLQNDFWWPSIFQQLLVPIGKWPLPLLQFAKPRLMLEELSEQLLVWWLPINIVFLLLSTRCLLVTMLRICLTDSYSMSYHAAFDSIIMTVEYVGIVHWWCNSLMMMTWELWSSLAIKSLSLFLKAFLTLSQIRFFIF